MKRRTTFQQKPADVTRSWHIVDAKGKNLGRISTEIAMKLMGKHKPAYTPYSDNGDIVIVINAGDFTVTGNKMDEKMYYRHSGHAGALKEKTLKQQLAAKPTSIIQHSVKGMLPKNKLQAKRMMRLHLFVDDKHPHEAQKPKELEV